MAKSMTVLKAGGVSMTELIGKWMAERMSRSMPELMVQLMVKLMAEIMPESMSELMRKWIVKRRVEGGRVDS